MLMTSRSARRVLLGQLLALLAASPIALAQPRRARVGWLSFAPMPRGEARTPSEALLLGALRLKGWSEPGSLVLESRGPAADKTLAMAAAELVSLRPEVLVSAGTPAIRALRDQTSEIPIVMVGAGDPVGTGLVASLARPGGNVTGVSWRLDDLIPKTLSLLHEMVPRARRVDLVIQAGDPGHAHFAKVMADAARARGLASLAMQVKDADELVAAISGSTADALLLIATSMIYRQPERFAEAAVARRLPIAVTGGPARDATASGLLCSYTPREQELYRRAAECIDRILRGAKPVDIPVEQPLRYDFVINLKTARAMGLKVPRALRLSADELIE
jgi:putative ABC transport system substrate-binding protein